MIEHCELGSSWGGQAADLGDLRLDGPQDGWIGRIGANRGDRVGLRAGDRGGREHEAQHESADQ